MNLGLAKTDEVKKEGNKGPGQIIISIRDPFIKRYKIVTGVYALKSGNIGSLNFYLDNTMGYDDFRIYDQDKEYRFTFTTAENIREYLSDTLDKVLNGEVQPFNLEMNMNDKIEFKLDKNLPQTEFLQKQREMEIEMAKLNIVNKK